MDTQFLGGDILDEEHQLRPGQGGVDAAVFNLADAVILGNIGDDTSSFETLDSGFHLKNDLGAARLYVSGRSQAVMSPDAVIATIDKGEHVRLTPFEKHVLRFIDGKRPVEAIRRQAGLDEAEVKTALANLADKGVVKVVGRALADVDFDGETAPGNAPKSRSRRMRGTLVGAVVVVGDAADQAIDDAFRTNVRSDRPDLLDIHPPADDDGVFSASGLNLPNADSADVNSFDQGGTEEVMARRPSITSTTSTVRPAALRDAVNAGGRTGVRGSVPVFSDVDASDGFDEFGVPSDVATAMVRQPSLSGESSLPGIGPLTNRLGGTAAGAFADRARRDRGLSDLDDFDTPGVDDLADSRVEPRPVLPSVTGAVPALVAGNRQARGAPAAIPSLSQASRPEVLAESGSLNDDERDAWRGGVWGNDDDGDTNIKEPMAGHAESAELSMSLSELLESDLESDLESNLGAAAKPSAGPAVAAPHPPTKATAARDAGFDSDEEPTALREPPVPLPRTTPATPVRPPSSPALLARSSAPRPPAVVAPPPSPSSMEGLGVADDIWEQSTAQARPLGPMKDRPAAAPAPSLVMAEARGAADDLFPEDDGQAAVVVATAKRPPVLTSTQGRSSAPKSLPSYSSPFHDGQSSVEGGGDDSQDSAWSMSSSPARRGRAQPPPPEPSRFDSRAQESVSRAVSPGPGRGAGSVPTEFIPPPPGLSSSAEALDSAMVIRPAAKAVSLAMAAQKVRAPTPPPPPDDEGDDFMVDPDATLNLPAQPKSVEGEERRKRKQAGARTEGTASQPLMAEPQDKESNSTRRQPSEDMRRKARNLMELAQNDHAVGRVGAARMNAKLATIYDPDNDAYRRILADWERPSADADASRPEYVMLYEQAQELEDADDVDGALVVLEKGLYLAPNPAAFHNRIGVLLAMRKRDYQRAKEEIQKAIALEPKNPHYSNNLGKVMAKANRRRGDVVATAR